MRRSWAICDAMVDVSSMLSALRRKVRNASHPYYRTQPHATAINVDGLARLRGTGGSVLHQQRPTDCVAVREPPECVGGAYKLSTKLL